MATEVLDATANKEAIETAIDDFAGTVTSIDETSIELVRTGPDRVCIYLSYSP